MRSRLTRITILRATVWIAVGIGSLQGSFRLHLRELEAAPASGRLTFSRDVAPILFRHCATCHRPSGPAPFTVLSYEEVREHARLIVTKTQSRLMPPWPPQPGYGTFTNERRLTVHQIETIRRWVQQGAIEGDRGDLPPQPQFTEGWQLGQPDLVVKLPEPFMLPAGGMDVFRNFVIPLALPATRYVRAVELRPGNPGFVHHALVAIDKTRSARRLDSQDPGVGFGGMDLGEAHPPDGQLVVWAPGLVPFVSNGATAWRLEPGSDLVLQLHMLPSGKPEMIQPSVGFHFANAAPTGPPLYVMRLYADAALDILPGAKNFVVTDTIDVPADIEVLAVHPHAHFLAKTVEAWATLPNGTRRWLIRIPEWNFNSQDVYWYAKPISLPRGTTIRMRYSYDNSADNVSNPSHPPRRVTAGDRSSDEMAHLSLQVRPRRTEDVALLKETRFQHSQRAESAGHIKP